jgi:hypothetical protein
MGSFVRLDLNCLILELNELLHSFNIIIDVVVVYLFIKYYILQKITRYVGMKKLMLNPSNN